MNRLPLCLFFLVFVYMSVAVVVLFITESILYCDYPWDSMLYMMNSFHRKTKITENPL